MIRNIKYNEVFGENKKGIFDKIGLLASSTDYANRLSLTSSGYVLSDSIALITFDEEIEKIMSRNLSNLKAPIVNSSGDIVYRNVDNPLVGIRLSGNYSDVKDKAKLVEDLGNGIKIVEYGEYPAYSVSEIQGQKFYEVDKEKTFLETGKTYWVPNLGVQIYKKSIN